MSKTKKKTGEISRGGMIFKSILFAAMLAGLYFAGTGLVKTVTYKSNLIGREDRHLNNAEENYVEKEYGRLYDRLSMFSLTSEKFDVYWEVAEAAVALEDFKQWHRAEQKGLAGSAEKKEYYYNEVMAYARDCKFERNRRELNRFAEEATMLWEQTGVSE